MTKAFNESEIQEAMTSLTQSGWNYSESSKAITKVFKFKNFIDAMGWLIKVGMTAEKLNHHPEIKNSYNRVEILLTTHDAGGLTEKDIHLATLIDKLNR
ncbi:MAG: 4a-hydroxytetrahydrobiopterin dehydratase [Rhodobacteraceae bacterium]|nr:4a-hydroxytetrahydrobiopterin dehydratase [Paracoccaceae bacterium]